MSHLLSVRGLRNRIAVALRSVRVICHVMMTFNQNVTIRPPTKLIRSTEDIELLCDWEIGKTKKNDIINAKISILFNRCDFRGCCDCEKIGR